MPENTGEVAGEIRGAEGRGYSWIALTDSGMEDEDGWDRAVRVD